MEDKDIYGILIDYEYCTGCYTCVVACAQEYGYEPGVSGMRVMEIVEKLPNEKYYLVYLPFPTEVCTLCIGRVKRGLEPQCVKHCMSRCLDFGPLESLIKKMKEKKRTVLFRPR
ncbi:MAG: oxidoreductase [Deltaproteobacteria bacterium]|nr:oxidoreductase [Deltaproteobacteria bacterium]